MFIYRGGYYIAHDRKLCLLAAEQLTPDVSVWVLKSGNNACVVVPSQPAEEIGSEDEVDRLVHATSHLAYRLQVQEKVIVEQSVELEKFRLEEDGDRKVMLENEALKESLASNHTDI